MIETGTESNPTDQNNHAAAWWQRNAVPLFFALTFLLSWGWWGAVGWLAPGNIATGLILPGAWAPTIAALLLTWRYEGRNGVKRLLQGLTRWRVGWRWYAVAIVGPLAAAFVALALFAATGGRAPHLEEITALYGLGGAGQLLAFLPVLFLLTIVGGGPIAEELGWRGFAQSRLEQRIGAARAGLLIGVVWALWHLPLFYIAPAGVGNLPLPYYLPLVSAWGVWFAWLHQRTGGSVWLAILLHAGINFVIGALQLVTLPASDLLLLLYTLINVAVALPLYIRLERADAGHAVLRQS